MRINHYTFYCFDDFPLELADDRGVKYYANPVYDQTDPISEQKTITDWISFHKTRMKIEEIWCVTAYWNTGKWGLAFGVGKKPIVRN